MAKKTKPSNISGVEEKLRSLYDLQIVDRRIDEIRNLRGELPLEVQDLEDEIAGMQTRFSKVEEEISSAKNEITGHKQLIKECQEKISKYEEQQKNVRIAALPDQGQSCIDSEAGIGPRYCRAHDARRRAGAEC